MKSLPKPISQTIGLIGAVILAAAVTSFLSPYLPVDLSRAMDVAVTAVIGAMGLHLVNQIKRLDTQQQADVEDAISKQKSASALDIASINALKAQISASEQDNQFVLDEAKRLVLEVESLKALQRERHDAVNAMQKQVFEINRRETHCENAREILSQAVNEANRRLVKAGLEPVYANIPLLTVPPVSADNGNLDSDLAEN